VLNSGNITLWYRVDLFARTLPDVMASLEQALTGIAAVLWDRLTERAYLERCVGELQTRLQALPRETPAYGIIHGDAIRANALVADDGSVTAIDFDWYGLGWRAYDVASYLLTIRGDPNEHESFFDQSLGRLKRSMQQQAEA
jgi:Ser/Thr protein kinase RdoA (MazF antagonist)